MRFGAWRTAMSRIAENGGPVRELSEVKVQTSVASLLI